MERDHNSQFGFYQETPSGGVSSSDSRCGTLHDSLFVREEAQNDLNDETLQYHGNPDGDDSFYVDGSYSLGSFNPDEQYGNDAFGPPLYRGVDEHSASHPAHETGVDHTVLSDSYINWSPISHGTADNVYDFSLLDASLLPLDERELLMGMNELNDVANIGSQCQEGDPSMLLDASVRFPKEETPVRGSSSSNAGNQTQGLGSNQETECIKQRIIGPRKEWALPPLTRRGRKPKVHVPSDRQKMNDSSNPKARPRRSRPLEPEVRRQATMKRQNKLVCVICHFKKETCHQDPDNPDGPCIRCKYSPMLCVRYRITDAALYREQKAPFYLFSQRWKTMEMVDIKEWENDKILTAKFSLIALDAPYELKVRRSVPLPGDNLEESYCVNGTMVTYSIPPYGIANMEEAAASIGGMVEREISHYILAFVGETGTDPIIWETYMAAFKRANADPTPEGKALLSNTFRLWVFCRNISSPEHNVGEEKLGKRQVDDSSGDTPSNFPECGPVIAAQLECIYYTQFLRPLSRKVLRSLMSLLTTRDKKYWFTIYLVLFMLLHSCSMITQRDMESAAALKLPTEYCNPDSIREHKVGAKTLLAYYHLAIKGSLPFKKALEGNLPDATFLGIKDEDVMFITRSARLAAIHKPQWDQIRRRKAYGDDFYWISQLYDQNWEPEKMD